MATKVYEGTSTMSSKILYTLDRGKIFEGTSTMSSHEVKNVSTSDITIDRNKVFKGKSKTSSNQIFNLKDSKIYKGTSTMSSNQLAHIEGDRISDSDFAKILVLIAKRNNLI